MLQYCSHLVISNTVSPLLLEHVCSRIASMADSVTSPYRIFLKLSFHTAISLCSPCLYYLLHLVDSAFKVYICSVKKFLRGDLSTLCGWTLSFDWWKPKLASSKFFSVDKSTILDLMSEHNTFCISQGGMAFLDQSGLKSSSLSQSSHCLRTPNEEFWDLFIKYEIHNRP